MFPKFFNPEYPVAALWLISLEYVILIDFILLSIVYKVFFIILSVSSLLFSQNFRMSSYIVCLVCYFLHDVYLPKRQLSHKTSTYFSATSLSKWKLDNSLAQPSIVNSFFSFRMFLNKISGISLIFSSSMPNLDTKTASILKYSDVILVRVMCLNISVMKRFWFSEE